jgi:hypothetical protein
MTICTLCESMQPDALPQSHAALQRKAVRQRFLDVFEFYECLMCGAKWERAILTPDKHPVRYRWKLTSGRPPNGSRTPGKINWTVVGQTMAAQPSAATVGFLMHIEHRSEWRR